MDERKKGISFRDITVEPGFWHERQRINAEATVYAVWDRFKETGRFDALHFEWTEGKPNKPHFFWDSDIAKWLEAAAYIIAKKPDTALEQAIDEAVDLMEAHQWEDGYYNMYFTLVEPDKRFTDRDKHELYCAGHLIEAAVAYYEATGKDKFLNLMRRYADYIERVFTMDRSSAFATPGHEEIELALVRLFHATGEKRYLALSRFFIDKRGSETFDDKSLFNAYYAQDHLPVREQCTAEGHAVRAMYLYCAMADLAREYGDESLYTACRRIFENIATRRMYITGGIGSAHEGEAFTVDYDLPNLAAYTETCAAIGLVFFSRRMALLEPDSLYADTEERALYNGLLSGISLDGKAFLYTNPLEIRPGYYHCDTSLKHNHRLPGTVTERQEIFDCACCPPNITRLIASIGDSMYTCDQDTLYVHHYIASKADTQLNGTPVNIAQKTDYPRDGHVSLTVAGESVRRIAMRVPGWCENYRFTVDGGPVDAAVKKGYAYIDLDAGQTVVDADFEMDVRLMEASPHVAENAGRVAVQRGPIVYCMEAVDNGPLLRDIRIDSGARYEVIPDGKYGVPVIKTVGYRRDTKIYDSVLYRPVPDKLEQISLTFIPYFGFANRGESEMLVWVLKK